MKFPTFRLNRDHDYSVKAPGHDKTLPTRDMARKYVQNTLRPLGVESEMYRRDYVKVGKLRYISSMKRVY